MSNEGDANAFTNDDDSSLIRQRRNLLAASATILFMEWAGVSFDNRYNVSGMTATVANPSAVIGAIWLLWWYWLYRYSVFYEEAKISGMLENVRAKVRLDIVQKHLNTIALLDPGMKQIIEKEVALSKRTFAGLSTGLIKTMIRRHDINGLPDGWIIRSEACGATYVDVDGGIKAISYGGDFDVSEKDFRPFERIVYWSTLLRRSYLTQFWLPFWISAPVVVLIWISAIHAAMIFCN